MRCLLLHRKKISVIIALFFYYRKIGCHLYWEQGIYFSSFKNGGKNDAKEKCRHSPELCVKGTAAFGCNLLSMKEGLTPCYTIKGSTNPALWGTSPVSTRADDWKSVTCNFDADGYRLPTEAEWEYAARGGKTGITDGSWDNTYSGSDTPDDVAWYYNNNSDRKTHEVGKKQANALGIYDMSGNGYEWCWDWYGSSSSDYPSGTEDPAGPDTGSYRVVRGGCWAYGASSCTVSYRGSGSPPPSSWYNDNSFRLVRSAR